MLNKKNQAPVNKPNKSVKGVKKHLIYNCDLNHMGVVELLDVSKCSADTREKSTEWFVEIKVVDKLTGEITPLKVLL